MTQNRIYRNNTSNKPYDLLATITAASSFNDTGLTKDITYYYVVTAVNSAGLESDVSNQAAATAR